MCALSCVCDRDRVRRQRRQQGKLWGSFASSSVPPIARSPPSHAHTRARAHTCTHKCECRTFATPVPFVLRRSFPPKLSVGPNSAAGAAAANAACVGLECRDCGLQLGGGSVYASREGVRKCLLYFRERVCLGKECLNLKQIESLQ